MTTTRIQKLEGLFKADGPILRSANLRSAKFCSKDIAELIKKGQISQVRRGYYAWGPLTETLNDMEVVASLIPEGILSYFSAAQYHDLTTVIPGSIEITLPSSMRTPALPGNLHVAVHKSANHIYPIGIETVQVDNHTLKVYDRERTVCDFIRNRLKIGKDVALEVLKNYMDGKKNLQKLYEYAKLLQIEGVINPYVEVLV
ncbi:abortive infection protein [Spirochaetia bacterium]|nr:abortive infection protein [Spirochaetia bacterium]